MIRQKIYIFGKEGTTGLQIYERLGGRDDIELLLIDEEKRKDVEKRRTLLNAADLVFLCLPDAAAREAVSLVNNEHTRIIDCSTAHRTAQNWVYGFPELHGQREKIKTARRVANPGCYATGFLSLMRPLVEMGALEPNAFVTCHALSGYTGAGKKAIAQYTDSDREQELDSPRHYAVTLAHKHIPEMMAVSGLKRRPIFMPMICDFPQGMTVTAPLFADQLQKAASIEEFRSLYGQYYRGSSVVELRPAGAPSCGFIGSNNLAGRDILQIFVNGGEGLLMLTARLDNLGKGASGAAVQNMNLMLGFEETKGLNL